MLFFLLKVWDCKHAGFIQNQSLANYCSAMQPPLEANWRAYREINDTWGLLKENAFECRYISRSQNGMADYLVKLGSSLENGFTDTHILFSSIIRKSV